MFPTLILWCRGLDFDAAYNCLEAFELWCNREMLRIPWTYHVTNATGREAMKTVKEGKCLYLCHIMRNNNNSMLQLAGESPEYAEYHGFLI